MCRDDVIGKIYQVNVIADDSWVDLLLPLLLLSLVIEVSSLLTIAAAAWSMNGTSASASASASATATSASASAARPFQHVVDGGEGGITAKKVCTVKDPIAYLRERLQGRLTYHTVK